jgi:hypothetical protein
MFGRPSRAYHLKGYGAVVVLAPRALPRVRRHVVQWTRDRAFDDALNGLERTIEAVRDPEERARLESTLAALREGLPPGSHRLPRPRIALAPREIESWQEEAEAFRREAEQAMEKAERNVMIRLRVPEDALPALPPVPPLPPVPRVLVTPQSPVIAPAPPAPPTPRVKGVAPAAPVPSVPPVPPVPAGWPFWFGEEDAGGAPDSVLTAVRAAIVSGLGAYRGDLALLGADEFVVVAVDFLPAMAERSSARTVVARARKRDLADHRAGRLAVEAFRARVEFDEY